MASMASSFLLLVTLPFLATLTEAQTYPPLVSGLAYNFYSYSCPNVESIVQAQVQAALKTDIGLAAGLLRIHFHDCFVQGCDGSVLLTGTGSEQQSIPNLTLRPAALTLINNIRAALEKACGRVVSCSDIATLAARDSVYLSGGPNYPVPLGRRDGLTFASNATVLSFLPSPFANVTTLINAFARLNLDVNDLVSLSGGHTIGIGHCPAFTPRLYPVQDNSMDQYFAGLLKQTCPASNTNNFTNLDIRSPNVFDNKYYVNLMNRQGLFTSDQGLYTDSRTKNIVTSFAIDQNLFFQKFAYSMVKMGMLSVLTGSQGQIRANCAARNPGTFGIETVVDGGAGGKAAAATADV